MFLVVAKIEGFQQDLTWSSSDADRVITMCRKFVNLRGLDIPLGTGDIEFLYCIGSIVIGISNDLTHWESLSIKDFENIINEV